MKRIKRQADILVKKFKIPHHEGLEIAAQLNGFKDWHQAQLEIKKAEESIEKVDVNDIDLMKQIVNTHDTMKEFAKTGAESEYAKEYEKSLREKGLFNFEVTTRAVAEITTHTMVEASNPNEAVQKVRKMIDEGKIGEDFEEEDWQITYLADGLWFPMKIVTAYECEGGYLHDEQGIDKKVDWVGL